jgi:hypothetical protein
LYKKRWDIEVFFKAMKQKVQIKTFLENSENAVKSQIYVAVISYLMLELINRTIAKKVKTFSNFIEKIRVCLAFYLSIEYVCNQVNEGALVMDKHCFIIPISFFWRSKCLTFLRVIF